MSFNDTITDAMTATYMSGYFAGQLALFKVILNNADILRLSAQQVDALTDLRDDVIIRRG